MQFKDDIKDFREIGRTIQEMDNAQRQEIGHYRKQHGKGDTDGNGGYGQENNGSGNG